MKRVKNLMDKRKISVLIIFILVLYVKVEKKRLQELIKLSEKNSLLYLFSTQWLYRKINGEEIFICLADNGYKKIAVYGKNHSCECLCSELENMGIEVAYIIDDKARGRYGNIPIVTQNSIKNDVDAIIVTNLENAECIKNDLQTIYSGPILILGNIVKWGNDCSIAEQSERKVNERKNDKNM